MNWHRLPAEIQSIIIVEVIQLAADDAGSIPLQEDKGEHWRELVTNCRVVCKEWSDIVQRSVNDLPVEAVIFCFPESVVHGVLQRAIARLRRTDSGEFYAQNDMWKDAALGVWLVRAVQRRFTSCVRLLLERGAPPDWHVWYERLRGRGHLIPATPLQIAFRSRYLDIAELLVDYGSDLKAWRTHWGDELGFELLKVAAEKSHFPLAKALLNKGVPVDINRSRVTPLSKALEFNNPEMAIYLVEQDASFLNDQYAFIHPLTQAVRTCSLETISRLIDLGAELNVRSDVGEHPLGAALEENRIPVARFLIDQGARLDVGHVERVAEFGPQDFLLELLEKTCHQFDNYALEAAAISGNMERVRWLLDDVGVKPKWLPLDAISYNRVEVVKTLLAVGADPNTPTDPGGNSLYRAAEVGSVEMVKLMLDGGVPVNSKAGRCQRALQVAAAKGHEEVVQVLLDNGADVHHRGGKYTTALNAAAQRGSETIQRMLLEHGHPPL